MGIIRAGLSAAGGALGDQWLEAIEANEMDNRTLMTKGVLVARGDKRNQNKKATPDVISDGSIIHVGEKQAMLLVDGGKIIDYSVEPGYFEVKNENAPSLFSGDLGGALSDAYNRLKFGGSTPYRQQVFFVNTQEIQDIPYGTSNAINYFDNFYNAELYIKAHGYYTLRITNPLIFYSEMASHNADRIDADDMKKIALSEFLTAFQTALGQMSVDGVPISQLPSKTTQLAKEMGEILDKDWEERRGMRIESVGVSSITYDDASKKLIDIRNQGAMLKDGDIRAGYVQGAAARGVEAAGANPSGAGSGFMAVNMGMSTGGGLVEESGKSVAAAPSAPVTTPSAGGDSWSCSKQHGNQGGKFCSTCGEARPQGVFCPNCGTANTPDANFCVNCGQKLK